MASVAAPHLPSPIPSSSSYTLLHANPSPRPSSTLLFPCRGLPRPRARCFHSMICRNNTDASAAQPSPHDGPGKRPGWESFIQNAVRAAVKRWEDYVASFQRPPSELSAKNPPPSHGSLAEKEGWVGTEPEEEWDWERWKQHFEEVEEQERIALILRAQLQDAICREDYNDAAKLKRAVSSVTANDAVGNAIKQLNRAIKEELYHNAAFFRDHASTGLVGWWAGISDNSVDPHGRIIQITAEYGRYVARSFTSRQLAAGESGLPLFEVYLTLTNDGNYKQQAVYMQRNNNNYRKNPKKLTSDDGNSITASTSTSGGRNGLPMEKEEETEASDDESQVSDEFELQNALDDMVPGVKVKIVKVVASGKMDRDIISNVVDQIIEEDEEEDSDKETELGTSDSDIDLKESDSEEFAIDTEYNMTGSTHEFLIGGISENFSLDMSSKESVLIPAMLEKKGRSSFSFSVIQDNKQVVQDAKEHDLTEQSFNHSSHRSVDSIMSDLAKVLISKKKIPLKVLKDVVELIRFTVNQDQHQQPFRGTMFFNRIEVPMTSDPLSGLYVGAHGMLTREVLNLRRKFGQWNEDEKNQESSNLEFYEYVEAFKLTGDVSVPAGQVAFRAKIGQQNQLPYKGIIPEEFGVIARYKGQGRVADPGFRNPRWVDGELIILDGKYIRGGPVVGFIYWAPEYHFLMFFNRLKLQDVMPFY